MSYFCAVELDELPVASISVALGKRRRHPGHLAGKEPDRGRAPSTKRSIATLLFDATRALAPSGWSLRPRRGDPNTSGVSRWADLFLDTLPYNAGATTTDALSASLPVLTCSGQTYVGRMAGALLSAIGLPELITSSLEAYEGLALRLATEPGLLSGLRQRLARNRSTMPLFDTARFTRHIESAHMQNVGSLEGGPAACRFCGITSAAD